ncbi:chromosome transmission fidelity protein 18 homolog [Punica granatum]|uniref:Chromosome transmission fidelity protein 18 homolog n=1 Tax=Punica granatum TaxID=22663 RepID=A0A6P8EIS6_PUNGR|nr:chromosome transmission fidelity protein 18 homolog [Punica granatum]
MEDMDIPLPDELEWLESQRYREEDDDYDIDPFPLPLPPDDEKDEVKSEREEAAAQSPPPSIEPQINVHKRSLVQDETAGPSNEKRSRTTPDPEDDDDEEDWLRYSPPRKNERMDHRDQAASEPEEIVVSRYVSRIDGECVPVTAPTGDRVYAKLCRADSKSRDHKLRATIRSGGLISEPVNIILQRSEQEAFAKALHASSEDQSNIMLPETPMFYEKLWVDKYAPRSFTELLSDEQTNREVLLWLKQWDSCVFGSEIRTTNDDVLSALRRHSSVTHHQKCANSNFIRRHSWSTEGFGHRSNSYTKESNSKWNQEPCKNSRLTGPLEHKILLLCGPPGLGKTTLAHVAAKHCGYRVVEINASDDRSSSTIEAKILDVVQMNSVMADSKPKCLIIDEIDGALGDGKGAVEVIMKMVSAEKKVEMGNPNTGSEEKLGKNPRRRRKTSSLSRPVICICNDLYTPALRPLRQIAKVHIFVRPSVNRVVSRLKYICNKEGINTSSIALTALAEYTECDIRHCLNTLQFLKNKKETLNVVDISSQVVGRKDMSRNIFDIWKEIFQKKKFKPDKKSNHDQSSMSREFDVLHSLISSRGDYDVILDGVHENILQQRYHDPVMKRTVMCLNSMSASDLIHQYTMRSQQMHLQVYQPPLAIAVHRLIAQVQKPSIEWPKSFQRFRATLMERLDTLRIWQYRITPSISRHLSIKSFVEDLITPLMRVLSPPNLRPVAMHLLSESEKSDLTQLVSRMVAYCISYKNTSSELLLRNLKVEATVDANALAFDPPIGDYISFKDYVPSHHVLPLAMKQVLLHEVEKQKVLQGSGERSATSAHMSIMENKGIAGSETCRAKSSTCHVEDLPKINMENKHNKVTANTCMASNNPISSTLSPTGAATTNARVKATKDAKWPTNGSSYFDRFRKLNSINSQKPENAAKPVKLDRDSHPVLFKFNEGFTNAIKRPMRIRDFLL